MIAIKTKSSEFNLTFSKEGSGSVQLIRACSDKSLLNTLKIGSFQVTYTGADAVLVQTVEDLKALLKNFEVYEIELPVILPDNSSENYELVIPNLKASKDYALVHNSPFPNVATSLHSWRDGIAVINVYNNRGTDLNEIFNLKIKEIINPLN